MITALKLAGLALWLVASVAIGYFVFAIVYLGRGLAPPDLLADLLTTVVLGVVLASWAYTTVQIVKSINRKNAA